MFELRCISTGTVKYKERLFRRHLISITLKNGKIIKMQRFDTMTTTKSEWNWIVNNNELCDSVFTVIKDEK